MCKPLDPPIAYSQGLGLSQVDVCSMRRGWGRVVGEEGGRGNVEGWEGEKGKRHHILYPVKYNPNPHQRWLLDMSLLHVVAGVRGDHILHPCINPNPLQTASVLQFSQCLYRRSLQKKMVKNQVKMRSGKLLPPPTRPSAYASPS